jgi:hypothetical protein
MIYGINFGAPTIPDGVRRKFAASVSPYQGHRLTLVGVAQSEAERDLMLLQANNGRRELYTVERQTAAGTWYGIYAY